MPGWQWDLAQFELCNGEGFSPPFMCRAELGGKWWEQQESSRISVNLLKAFRKVQNQSKSTKGNFPAFQNAKCHKALCYFPLQAQTLSGLRFHSCVSDRSPTCSLRLRLKNKLAGVSWKGSQGRQADRVLFRIESVESGISLGRSGSRWIK